MEPLTEGLPEKKGSKSPERVTISETEAMRLDRWLKQVREASKGFLSVSRSDLVAFLVREHREELLSSEIKRLRADHYDPIKHMQWIMPQIKMALAEKDQARVAELQEELRGMELTVFGSAATGVPSDLPGGAVSGVGDGTQIRKKSKKKTSESIEANAEKNTTCIDENSEKMS